MSYRQAVFCGDELATISNRSDRFAIVSNARSSKALSQLASRNLQRSLIMSVLYLRLIPTSLHYIPPESTHSVAQEALSRLFPEGDIYLEVYKTTEFIDQGENFEYVRCPFCGADLVAWWGDAMDAAYEAAFEDLSITTPCCHQQTSLEKLDYRAPAGFARFVLSVRNPNRGDLTEREIELIETILNCKLKQVWAMY
ncbi:hypothetical protein H6F67_23320 [Microcoleus sp. FACHB-1515]|uniref:hypothetical protein n=1 Tax=Cyanophyceae TaxID=3028117 RepID=UPI0016842A9B|nr:hypothetical protein [Microcoleus sp. FACHB-1515]MBD2092787.1 hypothetical protein [Microcoleus sp. FACHB-1515]